MSRVNDKRKQFDKNGGDNRPLLEESSSFSSDEDSTERSFDKATNDNKDSKSTTQQQMTQSENHDTTPGAYWRRGRAFGSYPAWGREGNNQTPPQPELVRDANYAILIGASQVQLVVDPVSIEVVPSKKQKTICDKPARSKRKRTENKTKNLIKRCMCHK